MSDSIRPQTPKPRGRTAPEDTRKELIEATLAILAEPAADLSLRSVCKRIGRSQIAAYTAFGKERDGGGFVALLAAVAAHGFELLAESLRSTKLLMSGDPADHFRDVAAAYLEFARLNPRLYRLMFGQQLSNKLHIQGLGVARWGAQQVLLDVVSSLKATGPTAEDDPLDSAICAWALMHGVSELLLDGQLDLVFGRDRTKSFERYAADTLLGGLSGSDRQQIPLFPASE